MKSEKNNEVGGRAEQGSQRSTTRPTPVLRLTQGRLSFANPAARKALAHWGLCLDDQAPRTIARTAARALSRNQKRSGELALGHHTFQVWFVPVKNARSVNLYFSEITQRKQAEKALREAHAALEKRVRERTQQLANVNAALQTEIWERKQTEQALRESEERFRLIVEGTQDYAIMLLDAGGRIATWNASAEQIHGYQAKEILGRHFSCLYTPEDIRGGKPARLLRMAVEKGRVAEEGWRVRKNGSQFWGSVVITPLYDQTGCLRGFSRVARDITERRQAQEALRKSRETLANFFEYSPLGLFWISPRGSILSVNKAGLQLLGCRSNECLNHSLAEFHVEPDSAAHALGALARGEALQDHQMRLRRPDGGIRHVLVNANGLWERGRMLHSRWFVRDISRRAELEREILAVAERERQRIGRDLHDDLCQQLTGIQFLSQTLAGQLRKGPPEQAARAREIAEMVRNAITRTRELSHGLSPMLLESAGLGGALRVLAQQTGKVFGVDCRFYCRRTVWNHDTAMSIHLYRIAQEAVRNAIKHGKTKRIDLSLARNRNTLVLTVKDRGRGLPRKLRRGGMGLRAMQYRADVMGGTLLLQRNPHGGTTVVCTTGLRADDPKENERRKTRRP